MLLYVLHVAMATSLSPSHHSQPKQRAPPPALFRAQSLEKEAMGQKARSEREWLQNSVCSTHACINTEPSRAGGNSLNCTHQQSLDGSAPSDFHPPNRPTSPPLGALPQAQKGGTSTERHRAAWSSPSGSGLAWRCFPRVGPVFRFACFSSRVSS